MKKLLVIAAAIALAAMVASPSFAGTDTKTFQVKANVIPSCVFTASSDIDFGNLDVHTGAKTASGSVSVQCTIGPAYTIGLDNGQNAVSGQRNIKGGTTDLIAYDLFQDAANSVAWKNADPDLLTFNGDGSVQVQTVYGVLNYSTIMPVESYLDVVTATVNF
ncbi:MAG: spore coat U domain-containing protein [Candidatus Methylomirabilales bacterium]